jgi:deoxycytidylate deaminase
MSQIIESSVMQYPYLPIGRAIQYVPASNRFMVEATRLRNECSTDIHHPTGAVVVKDGKIIGRGANQSSIKSKKLLAFHRDKFCMRRFLKVSSGHKYWLCPGCASSKHHAEARAVRDALKTNKLLVAGADLYLCGHWWCCKPCWDVMIGAGIRNVYLINDAKMMFELKR